MLTVGGKRGAMTDVNRDVRVGLFSDVHGNLTALQAVAAALEREQPLDHVVVAGDHLQGGAHPSEVWAELKKRGWALVRGNEDDALVHPDQSADNYPTNVRDAAFSQAAWTRKWLGPEALQDLSALPDRWRIPTPAGDLLVVHASPRSLSERAGGVRNTLAEVTAAYSGTGAAAIAFGHYHRSFVRVTPFALLMNVASVGLPPDNRPLANYTVVTASADGWIVEQHQVPYEWRVEEAVAQARGLPPWQPRGG